MEERGSHALVGDPEPVQTAPDLGFLVLEWGCDSPFSSWVPVRTEDTVRGVLLPASLAWGLSTSAW